MAAVVKGLISLFVFVLILASSWLIAVLLNYYGQQGTVKHSHPNTNAPPYPADRMDNLFWFVQLIRSHPVEGIRPDYRMISDLHISKFKDPRRVEDLWRFIDEYLDIIKPTVVMATGDLTDAKNADGLGSTQFIEEWETYARILRQTRVEEKTKWLDLRGNHDAFNVPSLESKQNYFRYYSSSGQDSSRGSSSYQYIYKTAYGEYAFNAIDTCPNPGPRRPFNFIGHVEEARVHKMKDLSERSKTANMTIWFGHYPFSTLTTPSLRTILRYGTVYLCGHLHTLNEVVPKMHAVHQDGHLELELGDWSATRNFRVLAIDHDLFSFVDLRLNTWPIILVTNPKDAHYLMPAYEPIGRINWSTHIRLLVFSPADITSVSIRVDDSLIKSDVQHVQGPLFVCRWNPQLYSTGIHTLNVTAKDSKGRVNTKIQVFSVDGTRPLLGLLPAIILLTDFCTLGRVVFYMAAIFIILGLWILRLGAGANLTGFLHGLLGKWLVSLTNLARKDSLFYPLFTYGVYIVIGPWFIGEVIQGHIGGVFVFGVYVNGQWIPGSLTFYYGIAQLLTFNLGLTLCLASYVSHPRHPVSRTSRLSWCRLVTHALYLMIVIWQASSCIVVLKAYGIMSFILSPVKTWSIPLAGYLWWKANHLK